MIKISPSILSADFSKLGDEVRDVCDKNIDYLHIDVMDGVFVPNISFGAGVMKSLIDISSVQFDVHLMISNPEKYIEDFATKKTEFITVHYEACKDLEKVITQIHNFGLKAGVSIKPATNPDVLDNYLKDIDMVLVMSVEPGFGGQRFMPESIAKIEYYVDKRKEGYHYQIEVDGGVSSKNANIVKNAGVDIIVAGSAVFNASDRTEEIRMIKE